MPGATSAVKATVLAVESLRAVGTTVDELQNTNQFYSAACRSRAHPFTVQVVLDTNLYAVGNAIRAADGVWVADLETLLKTKAATLVSRCSEKDLYDLKWLFGRFPDLDARTLISQGAEIDRGMTAESLLISLAGSPLEVSSCGFSLSQKAEEVFAEIDSLKTQLMTAFDKAARREPTPAVGDLIRRLRS